MSKDAAVNMKNDMEGYKRKVRKLLSGSNLLRSPGCDGGGVRFDRHDGSISGKSGLRTRRTGRQKSK